MAQQQPSKEDREAARQYLEHDYAAHHLKGQAAQLANDHAREIDEQNKLAREIALTGTANELGQLPPHLRAHQMRSRKQAGITTEHAARIRSGYRAPARAGRSGAPARRSVPSAPPTVRQRASSAGSSVSSAAGSAWGSATDTGWGALLVETIEWGMGLSIAYLLLTRIAAASKLSLGATNVVRAVVASNIDPLNPPKSL